MRRTTARARARGMRPLARMRRPLPAQAAAAGSATAAARPPRGRNPLSLTWNASRVSVSASTDAPV
jgi:hypothetical protein